MAVKVDEAATPMEDSFKNVRLVTLRDYVRMASTIRFLPPPRLAGWTSAGAVRKPPLQPLRSRIPGRLHATQHCYKGTQQPAVTAVTVQNDHRLKNPANGTSGGRPPIAPARN